MKARRNGNKRTVRKISRRRFLKLGLLTAFSGIVPFDAWAELSKIIDYKRALSFYNLHTKEYLDVVYWQDGIYLNEAMNDINHIFRDHYNGSVKPIDPGLLDFLYAIRQKLQCSEPYHLISGYRSRATNDRLRRNNSEVARRSLHIKGKAADIRLPGYRIKDVRHAAYELRGGGVGYYPRSNFVHIDVGQVRFWRS